jgi:hypothetical protein
MLAFAKQASLLSSDKLISLDKNIADTVRRLALESFGDEARKIFEAVSILLSTDLGNTEKTKIRYNLLTTKEIAERNSAMNSAEEMPRNGAPAYTRYHGREWVGVLADLDFERRQIIGKVMPVDPKEHWRFHSHPGLHVGYDEPIVYDKSRGMFYAPADYD